MGIDLVPMSRSGARVYGVLRQALHGLFRVWFRIETVGLDNVPPTAGFIVAPGAHRSILDTPIVAVALPRVVRFMGAEKYFDVPVLGAFLSLVGGFPIQRSTTDRGALRLSEQVLSDGYPLVVFPEATRFRGPLVQPLKEGATFLSARAQVPILPIGIGGAERSLGIGRYLPRPSRIRVIIGDPLYPPPPGDSGRVKRSALKAYTATLSETLQELFDRAQIASGA